MIYKNNISEINNIEKDLINRHLKYLWERNTIVNLKILAVEFLSQYTHNEDIFAKLEYLYNKENNRLLRKLLKKALEGENLFQKECDDSFIYDRINKSKEQQDKLLETPSMNTRIDLNLELTQLAILRSKLKN